MGIRARRGSSPRAVAPIRDDVIIGALMLLAIVTVPLLGGSLARLAELRLRWLPLAAGAFAVQVLIVNVVPEAASERAHAVAHVATYVVLALVLLRNVRLPGFWLVLAGGLSNALVITVNGGVMPASAWALRTAGLAADPVGFTNSGLVTDARLAFLGDVMAVPAWVPAANVLSVGDLLLVAGGWWLVHRTAGSSLRGLYLWTRRRNGSDASVATPQTTHVAA